jgi:predicted RNA binding protein YcfA (HicA-like mRNA interferase family)
VFSLPFNVLAGVTRTVGSHRIMKKEGWADYPFSFHDSEEVGPAILAKVAKKNGLKPAF